jgi:Protein of unknown function (DUF1501)
MSFPRAPVFELLLSRRAWLRCVPGGLLAGLTGPTGTVPARSNDAPSTTQGIGRAKSVIVVFASGGQSQLDMWDPKPDAPEEIRGEFRTIPTAVPGTRVCEHLPRVAHLADRYSLLRCVSHDDLDHGSAAYLTLTGQFHSRKSGNPPPQPTDLPTLGAVLHRVRPSKHLPYSAIHVNGPLLVPELPSPGQSGGFLGRAYEPLLLGDVTEEDVAVRGLEALPDLSAARQTQRRSLLDELENGSGTNENPTRQALATSYNKAYELLGSRAVRQAFDLTREPLAVRERYGLYRSGQACLMARRLVEVGVPWVTVMFNQTIRGQDKKPDETEAYGWDTHNDIFDALKDRLLPHFDWTFSALLLDLEQRGLLDETLVVCLGEFGRAPRVAVEKSFAGVSPGRKHWAAVYSIVLAGAGVTRGGVVGSSDRIGAYPNCQPVGPWDVSATMFAALGIDPAGHYNDLTGRPYPIATGKPIAALY